jgi:hypothetical protein
MPLLALMLLLAAPQVSQGGQVGPVATQVPDSFERLRLAGVLNPGEAIEVTDVTGRRISGRLSTLSATSLSLLTDAPRPHDFAEADVARIRRRDSLLNGLLIGVGIGLGIGFAAQGAFCGGYSDSECSTIVGVVISFPAAVGSTVAGVLIDRAIRKTVFRAAPR